LTTSAAYRPTLWSEIKFDYLFDDKLKGSVEEPNRPKFHIYETEKITREAMTSSCSVLSPEIVMHDAFNVIL